MARALSWHCLPEGMPLQKLIQRTARVILMITTVGVVIKYQVNRSKSVHQYQTSDPLDQVRNGRTYTCGCSLPSVLLGKDDLSSESDPHSDPSATITNRCFDSSELENVDVIIYPRSLTRNINKILQEAFSDEDFSRRSRSKHIVGFDVTQQGRSLSWYNDTVLDSFEDLDLFLNDRQQQELVISTNFTENRELLDFPGSFVAFSFALRCTNCTLCPLPKVNDIFKGRGLRYDGEPWGDCKYWRSPTPCTSDQYFYEARCVLYPTALVPLNFAAQTILENLQEMPGIENISPIRNRSSQNKISLTANMLYMNFSQVRENRKVTLYYFELPRESTTYSKILQLYPDLDTPCTSKKNVTVCNGTSVCNLFKITQLEGYLQHCSGLSVPSKCRSELHMDDPSVNLTVDDPGELWTDFGVKNGSFADLMCMNYSCVTSPAYSVSWQPDPVITEKDPLNSLLESNLLTRFWSRRSGLCTRTYKDVLRYRQNRNVDPDKDHYIFLETECLKNATASNSRGYCWLTGEFHNFTDGPDSSTDLSAKYRYDFSKNDSLFVCYYVDSQNFFVWFIVSFGVIFGWLGSIDMLFTYFLLPAFLRLDRFTKRKKRKNTEESVRHEGSESDTPGAVGPSLKSQNKELLTSSPDPPQLEEREATSVGTAHRRSTTPLS